MRMMFFIWALLYSFNRQKIYDVPFDVAFLFNFFAIKLSHQPRFDRKETAMNVNMSVSQFTLRQLLWSSIKTDDRSQIDTTEWCYHSHSIHQQSKCKLKFSLTRQMIFENLGCISKFGCAWRSESPLLYSSFVLVWRLTSDFLTILDAMTKWNRTINTIDSLASMMDFNKMYITNSNFMPTFPMPYLYLYIDRIVSTLQGFVGHGA